ncbi:MAG: hypothetical protein A3B38_00295 [Candidatus Levybacteria bacterium RIFCSPLOWO2_01_FULL_36_13]|nr:MAG: hypothetical protein A3B38_00295 [Candidatus Levybacteria bacterium RIFCSPLOWO2_01_FULL_36_13]
MEAGKENPKSVEERAMDALIGLRKEAGPLKKLSIRRALKDLKAGDLTRAENLLHEEALSAGDKALVAEHTSWSLGHGPGGVPKAWDRQEFYSGLAEGLRTKISEQNPK